MSIACTERNLSVSCQLSVVSCLLYNRLMHVLVVGSSVIDLFLNLDSDHYKIQDQKVLLELGDKIPSSIKKTAMGGNGANTSVGLTRLETPTTFYTYLGDDFFSREIQEGLSREGVDLDVERHNETNSAVHVVLDFPQDRVILTNYSKNPHGFSPKIKTFDFLFLTTIPDFWEEAYRKTLEFASENNIQVAFSPGTRQIEDKNDLVIEVVRNSKIYFSNKEEAIRVSGVKYSVKSREDMKKLLLDMKKMGPEVVSITDGLHGAYAIDREYNCFYIIAAPTKGTEKTGAGDAYATGFFANYILGGDTQASMLWGALNAGNVMEHVGAQKGLLTHKRLDEEIKTHNNLKAEKI